MIICYSMTFSFAQGMDPTTLVHAKGGVGCCGSLDEDAISVYEIGQQPGIKKQKETKM